MTHYLQFFLLLLLSMATPVRSILGRQSPSFTDTVTALVLSMCHTVQ